MDTMDFMDCPGKLPVLHFPALEFKTIEFQNFFDYI